MGQGDIPTQGLHALAEALAVLDTTEVRYYAAELSRLQGALLLQQAVPDAAQAEACFQQALAIARQQQAKSLELRAATSLARLWQPQGKHAEASRPAGAGLRRGSPRVLTRPTSRRLRRCWRSALDNDATGTV